MDNIHIATFSKHGIETALLIAENIGGTVWAPEKFSTSQTTPYTTSLNQWAEKIFASSDAIIFVCACGIAVRAIAPHIKSKETDPAIIVLDDIGKNVISLMSGHLGGANDLAKKIAKITNGNPIITTATDIHELTAIDEWAKKHNCKIENIKIAKEVSSQILQGHNIGVAITEEIIDPPFPVTLWLRPKNLVLGVGCKKNTEPQILIEAMEDFMEKLSLSPLSIAQIASIDLKKEEKAILALANKLSIPFCTFSAEELNSLDGEFTPSEKVKKVTGVDNVCERAAVLCSNGTLIANKTIYKGITFALAKTRRQKCKSK
ncbi:MAG: cobalt-precorrin 5A hydrolase [Synergistaceae bacterium]